MPIQMISRMQLKLKIGMKKKTFLYLLMFDSNVVILLLYHKNHKKWPKPQNS